MQLDEFFCGATVPGAHGWHKDAATSFEKVPSLQNSADRAPMLLTKEPGLLDMHTLAPVTFEYDPGAHGTQDPGNDAPIVIE